MKKLYDQENGVMRVAGLMSGSGSNLRKILEFEKNCELEKGSCPFKMVVIFSDCFGSNANKIGRDFDVPVITRDIKSFYRQRSKKLSDMDVRAEFDSEIVKSLSQYNVDVAAFGGYMGIASEVLIDAFLGVNVHPADLSLLNDEGGRKYTGNHPVMDQILSGEKYLRSSTHIVEEQVDQGRILMRSPKLEVLLNSDFDPADKTQLNSAETNNQNRLKEFADWLIFPKTLLYLSKGMYSEDDKGYLYFDERLITAGVELLGDEDSRSKNEFLF